MADGPADLPVPEGLNPAAGVWTDTVVALPPGPWLDLATGARWAGGDVPVGRLLARFPVALLERDG